MRQGLALASAAYGIFVLDEFTRFALVDGIFFLPALFWWKRYLRLTTAALTLAALTALVPAYFSFNRSSFVSLPPNLSVRVARNLAVFPGVAPLHRLSTDSLGFRVIPAVDYTKKAPLRIFTIGGSTTENIHLDDARTWSHRLQESLAERRQQKVEVINTGVSGLRADNHLATLKKIGPLYPDLVIFLVGFNDWNHQIREHFSTPARYLRQLRRRLSPGNFLSQASLLIQTVRASGDPQSAPIVDDGSFIAAQQKALQRPIQYEWKPEATLETYVATLGEIDAECRRLKVPCLFVDQTHSYASVTPRDLQDRYWMTPTQVDYTVTLDSLIHLAGLYNQRLRKFASDVRQPFCELGARIPPEPSLFFDDCHATDRGAEKIAEVILGCVEKVLSSAH